MLKLNLRRTALKWASASMLALAGLLQGCATANTGLLEHGIQPYNYGTTEIVDIKVLYGQKTVTFPGVRPSVKPPFQNGGGTYGVWMPIPHEMTVIWHTEKNGPEHRMTIPLEDKVSRTNPLANWKIRFYGDRIELWRQDETGPMSQDTVFRPRVLTKVFP